MSRREFVLAFVVALAVYLTVVGLAAWIERAGPSGAASIVGLFAWVAVALLLRAVFLRMRNAGIPVVLLVLLAIPPWGWLGLFALCVIVPTRSEAPPPPGLTQSGS